MRYQSALVLSTLAAGQAAAANARHASFHARRQAGAKRDMADVNWAEVSYDLSGVDWSSVFATPTPTPAPEAKPSVAEAAPVEPSKEAAPAPEPTSKKPAATSEAAPAQTESAGDAAEGFSTDVSGLLEQLGIKSATNSQSANGAIWMGSDSKYKATFTNDRSEDIGVACWTEPHSWINAHDPDILVGVKGGASVTLSFAQISGGCAPVLSDTTLVNGQVPQTWLEFTWGSGSSGGFDISREVNMKGVVMTAKGAACTSGVKDGALSCVFQCKDSSVGSCGTSGSYDLFGCGAGSGGGGGYNVAAGGTGGSCTMGNDGEHLSVTVAGHSDWPSA